MRPPQVGFFYRLPSSFRKSNASRYSDWIDSGIYIVTAETQNTVTLRLMSKLEFHGSGRGCMTPEEKIATGYWIGMVSALVLIGLCYGIYCSQ